MLLFFYLQRIYFLLSKLLPLLKNLSICYEGVILQRCIFSEIDEDFGSKYKILDITLNIFNTHLMTPVYQIVTEDLFQSFKKIILYIYSTNIKQ